MNLSNFKNVLVLAPHTDDGELGVGATISKLVKLGSNVHYAAFSTAVKSVPAGLPKNILEIELFEAIETLGIKKQNVYVYDYEVREFNFSRQNILEDLINLRSRVAWDLILMPSLRDFHQDHRTIAQEGLRAFKKTTILGYELVWNNLDFSSACFIEVSEQELLTKVSAIQCYKSQMRRDYVSKDFIMSLARVRGVQIGREYAECLEVIRLIIS